MRPREPARTGAEGHRLQQMAPATEILGGRGDRRSVRRAHTLPTWPAARRGRRGRRPSPPRSTPAQATAFVRRRPDPVASIPHPRPEALAKAVASIARAAHDLRDRLDVARGEPAPRVGDRGAVRGRPCARGGLGPPRDLRSPRSARRRGSARLRAAVAGRCGSAASRTVATASPSTANRDDRGILGSGSGKGLQRLYYDHRLARGERRRRRWPVIRSHYRALELGPDRRRLSDRRTFVRVSWGSRSRSRLRERPDLAARRGRRRRSRA